jgi:hypothetical protein
MENGYHQIPASGDAIEKTAFVTKFGLFEWVVMPQGVTNGPATFMRYTFQLLGHLPFVKVYLDVLIHSKSQAEHEGHLRTVFGLLRAAGLRIKRSKCEFFREQVDFVGFVFNKDGLGMEEGKIAAVRDWKEPTSPRQVRAFLGLAGYYRKFIVGFANIAIPLYDMSNAPGKDFLWTVDCEAAFQRLKYLITQAPILTLPTRDGLWTVRTDASKNALGAVLGQIVVNGEGRQE